MFACSQDIESVLKKYHVAASKQCGAGAAEVALSSRRLELAGVDCERPHQSTLLPKSSFLKAQLCGVEIFDRFHQATIRAESPRLSNWQRHPEATRSAAAPAPTPDKCPAERFWSCCWAILRT